MNFSNMLCMSTTHPISKLKKTEQTQATATRTNKPDVKEHHNDYGEPEIGTLLRRLFLASEEPCFIFNPFSGVIREANIAAENFFRLPGNTLVSSTVDKLYPQNAGKLYVFTDEVLEKGRARTRDITLLRPNGDKINIEHAATCIKHGDATSIVMNLVDLDALHRRDFKDEAESYLKKGFHEWLRDEKYFREIEREYQLILSAAGEGIYGVGVDGLTTFLNPAAESILGYRADELIGFDMHEIIHHHHSDGTKYPASECPIYNAFKQGKVNTATDEVFWHKNGSQIPVEYTSTPIVDAGELLGAVIVFRDVSERQNREDQLRKALIENAELREKLELENAYLQEEIRQNSLHDKFIGNSTALSALLTQIEMVAPTDANVLITGESGTGKELVAHELHRASTRSDRPLIRVNCAAIPRELFESEFFGHVKGSFSGATRDRVGRFQLADGGTLFLDEIGELELGLQAKLLRVVQEGKFERVGEERSHKVDVRLIAATNKDLQQAVLNDEFREDLYFRINVFPIKCLPLRQRSSDIPILAEHCLDTTCNRLNLPKPQLTRANVKMLKDYPWPGNIRELQNVIERAVILSKKGKLKFDFPINTQHTPKSSSAGKENTNDQNTRILTQNELNIIERENMARALKACNGIVSGENGVAKLLGLKPTTVYSRLKSWGISENR